jgi:lipoprotein-anchoring transpeptidase ErfK/SrfK
MRGRWLVAPAAGVAALGLAVGALHGSPGDKRASGRHRSFPPQLPQPVRPAFTVAKPEPLAVRASPSLWAPVRAPVVARSAPAAGTAVARLERETPEGTSNLVLLDGRGRSVRGARWVRVLLPVLPNNTRGWVPRAALGGYVAVDTRLVVSLERLRATLYKRGVPIFSTIVGVGVPGAPTPRGEFYVRNELTRFRNPFYGPVAFGTSARSAVLTDWPLGGYIGIHGTNEPQLLPGRVSHGCIRMPNASILRLAKLMPIGTPLTIR